jgi:rhamnose transport system substrate-binding protein
VADPASLRRPVTLSPRLVLAGLVLVEIILFSAIGTRFFSWDNLGQIIRLSTELGLISLAMTAVIVTGGIDLSVGATLGLSAIVFGKLWRDGHVPVAVAAGLTLLLGVVAGLLNGTIITRLRVHPLIVTLATMSLYRGIAQGVTGGSDSFSGFPAGFLAIGQDHLGPMPAQLPFLVAAAVAFYLLLERSTVGRAWSAIGFAPEGARHAGIPVERRVALAYVLSGAMAAAAALVYVARVGQAKADAGTNYELSAITAVVLGGTSIFGGRGSMVGTLLGLFAIVILGNGLHLADGPPELAGIATGVLLLVAIGLDPRTRPAVRGAIRRPVDSIENGEEPEMRNSQLAVLCGVVLAAALIVVGGNYVLVRGLAARAPAVAPGPNGGPPPKHLTIGMMPKSVGVAYFIACRKGATEAAAELGDTLLWDGPSDADPAKQNEVVDTWVTRGVDAIAVSVNNSAGISTALRAARAKGIKVITWDADAATGARDLFVNQATPEGIGNALMDSAAAAMGNHGHFAIITASLTAANQNEWIVWIKKRLAERYPDIKLDTIRPCDEKQAQAFDETKAVLNADPDVTMIMAISSEAVPGAAEAVTQSGRTDVHVVGLGLPKDNKKYVHAGVTTAVILWKTVDLGYLTVQAADAVCRGTLRPGDDSFTAGRLGKLQVKGDNVLLGVPFVFDKSNIDAFDF